MGYARLGHWYTIQEKFLPIGPCWGLENIFEKLRGNFERLVTQKNDQHWALLNEQNGKQYNVEDQPRL